MTTDLTKMDAALRNELFSRLSGKEIVRICNLSAANRQICQKKMHVEMWRAKIKEDFDFDYEDNDTYAEYLRLLWLYNTKFWIYTHAISLRDTAKYIFNSKAAALNFAYHAYLENYDFMETPFPKFRKDILTDGIWNNDEYFYIAYAKLDNPMDESYYRRHYVDYEGEYQAALADFAENNVATALINRFKYAVDELISNYPVGEDRINRVAEEFGVDSQKIQRFIQQVTANIQPRQVGQGIRIRPLLP